MAVTAFSCSKHSKVLVNQKWNQGTTNTKITIQICFIVFPDKPNVARTTIFQEYSNMLSEEWALAK